MMAAVLLAGAFVLAPPKKPPPSECVDSKDLAIFVIPRQPDERRPVRIVVASESDLKDTRWVVDDASEQKVDAGVVQLGGPPFGSVLTATLPVGRYRVRGLRGEAVVACERFEVRRRAGAAVRRKEGIDPIWEVRNRWGRDTENFYSLWVEHLFEAPTEAEPTWRPLHVALRDSAKNLLFDSLNLGEDGGLKPLHLEPDCADFPYTLRGYFAWKLGLPFGFRPCTRGTTDRAPTCGDPGSHLRLAEKNTRVRAFEKFIRWRTGGAVHSSTARGAIDDPESDLYPVALTRVGLRPGTVYADPYGHLLVVQKWIPQSGDTGAGPEVPGILYAVDAQPDGTVGRRRFWRGSFLFPLDDDVKGAGFKRFRPLRVRRRPPAEVLELEAAALAGTPLEEVVRWKLKPFSSAEMRAEPGYDDFSTEQGKLDRNGFYERMDLAINPVPMRPEIALGSVVDALTEEVRRRVSAVGNAEEWHQKARGKPIPMPEGAKIFQTVGGWEDYATPSRDMRLLIAIDAVRAFAARITSYPARFRLGSEAPAAARKRVEALLGEETSQRSFEYTKSDGTTQSLSVADVLTRAKAFEMTYNPNDCPELRWGAPAGSAEAASCRRKAPSDQTARMALYRPWFRDRRRPSE